MHSSVAFSGVVVPPSEPGPSERDLDEAGPKVNGQLPARV